MNRGVVLSVVIVNWNTCALLALCLDSINTKFRQLGAGSGGLDTPLPIEILVVDNASSDNSLAMMHEKFPGITLIENSMNLGFACANNQAIARTTGRYVLLLNSDTVVHPGALDTMVGFMDKNSQVGACGPRLLNGDGTLQHSCYPMLSPVREFWRLAFLERFLPLATYRMERWNLDTPRRVEVVKGACLLLRRKALEQVGVLDEGYFMYTEEVDLCYRLGKAGWELWYLPRAFVTHFGAASSKQAAETMYLQLYRSKIQFYRKFGGRGLILLAKVLYIIAYLPRALIASTMGLFIKTWRLLAHIYWRLLVELVSM